MEKTFAMIKPGVLQRRIVGEIISRLERKGFQIVAFKMIQLTKELIDKHYAEHIGQPYFSGLENYMLKSPVIVMVLEGNDAVSILRSVVGPTEAGLAPAGTIRGDYGFSMRNIIHASDSILNAQREIDIYFNKNEIFEYKDNNKEWIE